MGEVIDLNEYRARRQRKVWEENPEQIDMMREFIEDSKAGLIEGYNVSPVDWYILLHLSSDPDWQPRQMDTIEEFSQEIKRWRKAHKIGEES